MIVFSADQEELALKYLSEQLADQDTETARAMMNLARYVSDRGHITAVVSSGAGTRVTGVTYDGVWCME